MIGIRQDFDCFRCFLLQNEWTDGKLEKIRRAIGKGEQLMANPDSQELKYWRLMSELKKKILDAQYQAGDKMPSENELAAVYQVSRHTVRKALAL